MPIIILLGIFAFIGIIDLHNTCSTKAPAYSKEDLDKMLSQMVGKSKREAKKIANKYRKK